MPNFSRYASGVLGVCLIISLIGAKAFSKCTIIFAFLLFVSVSNLGVSFTQNDHVSFIFYYLRIDSRLFMVPFKEPYKTKNILGTYFTLINLILNKSYLFLSFLQIEKHWNETVNANCTVNCTYQTINGSFSGLSYHHGQEIGHLFKV